MDYLDWEIFEEVMSDRTFHVVDSGPLFGPVTEYQLKRNEDLQLVLETTSAANGQDGSPTHVPGAVTRSEDMIQFESFGGVKAVGRGVLRRGSKTSYNGETTKTIERSSLHSIEISYPNISDGCYLIEWIENLSDEFHWPSLDRTELSENLFRTIEGPISTFKITATTSARETGRTCAQIIVDGVEVVIGKSSTDSANISRPGYILYRGNPSEDVRRKIRNCLSFALGCYLIYLGETVYDKDWRMVATNARRSVMAPGEYKELYGFKPAPLGYKYQGEVSNEILSNIVNSIYEIYDAYELRGVLWRYWHAVNAPIHMKAASIGAVLEGLLKAYAKINLDKSDTKIISDTKKWKSIRSEIQQAINAADVSEFQREKMLNRIDSINQKPIGVLFEDIFSKLGLELGELEKDAWGHRNNAAHGGGVDEDNVVTIIRETKVLHVMFNRVLLALAGVKTLYVDFYNLGWPLVELQSAIKDDRLPT